MDSSFIINGKHQYQNDYEFSHSNRSRILPTWKLLNFASKMSVWNVPGSRSFLWSSEVWQRASSIKPLVTSFNAQSVFLLSILVSHFFQACDYLTSDSDNGVISGSFKMLPIRGCLKNDKCSARCSFFYFINYAISEANWSLWFSPTVELFAIQVLTFCFSKLEGNKAFIFGGGRINCNNMLEYLEIQYHISLL